MTDKNGPLALICNVLSGWNFQMSSKALIFLATGILVQILQVVVERNAVLNRDLPAEETSGLESRNNINSQRQVDGSFFQRVQHEAAKRRDHTG